MLSWLLPELLSNAFSNGLNEETKNRLVAEAKKQTFLICTMVRIVSMLFK
ncbi:hypothetical protein JCM13304A_20040 [Desulfothermus okinawensis JCM 13304]